MYKVFCNDEKIFEHATKEVAYVIFNALVLDFVVKTKKGTVQIFRYAGENAIGENLATYTCKDNR